MNAHQVAVETRLTNIFRTESGSRKMLEGDYLDAHIQVVTGADHNNGGWPFIVYLTPSGGRTFNLYSGATLRRAESMEDAFNQGAEMVMQHLELCGAREMANAFQTGDEQGRTHRDLMRLPAVFHQRTRIPGSHSHLSFQVQQAAGRRETQWTAKTCRAR